tara:strand:+ start:4337 stop:4612 length:276 start_codon:yes stop_codon:yes gene_type:complete
MKDKDAMKMFKGKDNKAEEMKEAKALKGGKITPKQYMKGEKMEGEGKKGMAVAKKASKDIPAGKMSPAQYAMMQAKEKKMANGGMPRTKKK